MWRISSDQFAFLRRARIAALLCAVLTMLLAGAARLNAQTVATYSFEDGTADGWMSFNGASTPTATNAAAYAGSYSLLTSTSSTGQGGPSISLNGILTPGATYSITAYVELTSGESASNVDFTIKRSDASCSGGTCYDTVGSYEVPVTDSGWVQIGGTYTASATETGLTLYAQLIGASTAQSFYLDNVVITETAPPPGGAAVASYTFADGGLDGWAPFGSATLTNTAPPVQDPNSDALSLLTTNRTATYMGPSLNLLSVNGLQAGAVYQVTAYVLLAAPDASNPTATISVKTTNCASASGVYSNAGTSGALSSAAWTKVTGTFSYSDLPGPPTGLTLFVQSSSATDSFYLGDVVISEIAPPPPNPSQQDNSGISSTFEDGGLDGWSGRGAATVANSTTTAHSGAHSLYVTGRTANWNGAAISVSNKMYPGSVYNVSVWVKLDSADGSSHVLNLSLQTTYQGTTSYPSVTAYPGVTVAADGNWHQINVLGYNMANNYDQGSAQLYIQTVPPNNGTDLTSFYVDDFQLSYVAPPTIQADIPSIFETYKDFFPVGAAVDMTDISGAHEQLLVKHFDSMTPGNELKWSSTESSKGVFDFTNADAEVGEAVCHGMKVRGQNLVWATGAQTPSYAFGDGTNSTANQAVVTANIQEHIQNEVQHFGKEVYAWDVINEPIDPSQPDCLVHGPFYQVLGPSYIDIALRAAREYAPAGTKLFINDYSTSDPSRLACLVKVIRGLRERGVPLDGIGHETHVNINYPSVQAVVHSIQTLHWDFPRLNQQITEMDVSVYNAGDTTSNYGNTIPPSVLAEQGWLYKQYFDAFRDLRGELSAVTIWGMADDDTWLDSFPVTRTDYPLPFDMQLQAKPAYWGIVDPTQLPGYGLQFSADVTPGQTDDQRVVTVNAQNGEAGVAYDTLLSGFTLRQVEGRPCSPVVTASGAYPILLGDIAAGGSASAAFTVDFSSCGPLARFELSVPWSNATYHTGTLRRMIEFRDARRGDGGRGWR